MMVQFDVKRVQKGTESFMVSFDFTKTAMGSRKLKSWIENPLINKDEIKNGVAYIVFNRKIN